MASAWALPPKSLKLSRLFFQMDQTDLRELEARCIQECAPWCEASCPIHVEAKSLCVAIAAGKFAEAAKIIRKTIPFPYIISNVCDRPCEDSCKRGQIGGAISIRALEKAALDFSPFEKAKIRPLPARSGRVAIIGGGLSGLTAALELTKKGYKAVIFEASERLGGRLWSYPDSSLPKENIERDFQVIQDLAIAIEFNRSLSTDFSLNDLRCDFQAIYLAIGANPMGDPNLFDFSPSGFSIDPISFGANMDGVFAGGSIRRGDLVHSPITSISDGKRAATSIDRFLQGVSVTASRENEGPYNTRLFTSIEGIELAARVSMKNPATGYPQDEAIKEASRCLRCECLECVKVCEYLATFKGYPKKYIRQIYNNLSIVMGQRHGNKLINSCSLCGLCKEVCPEDLHMGEVCKNARETMVEQGKMPPSAHEFAILDMEFSNGEECSLLRHQPGYDKSKLVFFPGCRLGGASPHNVEKTYEYLTQRLNDGVGLMLRCCGAPADWAGRKDKYSEAIEALRDNWIGMGSPTVITACSSCHLLLRKAIPEMSLVSLWEIIDTHGIPENVGVDLTDVAVALHDPCSSRNEPEVQEAVRNILRQLGISSEELPLNRRFTECCGYGGLMCFANRELSANVIRTRIEYSAKDYVAYCAVCQDHFLSQGKKSFHLLDLIFCVKELDDSLKRPVNYSLIRDRRSFLKKRLLEKFWGETVRAFDESEDVKLHLSPEVRDLIADRLILDDDLKKVIQYAEESGRKLVNKANGHFLAHHTLGNVTFWVEYSRDEDVFAVHNAYSHRMQILEEPKR